MADPLTIGRIAIAISLVLAATLLSKTPLSGPERAIVTDDAPLASSQTAVPAQALAAANGIESLPVAAKGAISGALGHEDAMYHVGPAGEGYSGRNERHDFAASFGSEGVGLAKDAGQWQLRLASYGYGEDRTALELVAPTAVANRVEYERPGIKEWYVNGPAGLQQGFTLARPPAAGQGLLTLTVAVGGGSGLIADPDGRGLVLGEGLAYRGLSAFDARGLELPAWLEVGAGQVSLHVDDRDAIYPLVVDPFVQQAKLTSSDGAPGDQFGTSVAISGDTVVVGAFTHDTGGNDGQGAAYVFVRPGGGWTSMTQVAKLTASDGATNDNFGISVAISGDTVVVGAFNDDIGANSNQGSAYVFVRPGGGWTSMTQAAKLTASDGAAADSFGFSVAISGDTVVVGRKKPSFASPSGLGSAYVFVRPGGGWTNMTETARLMTTDFDAADSLGYSVAISGDTVVAGAPFDLNVSHPDQGWAYVFVRPTGGWTNMTQTARLTASDGAFRDFFGGSVAIGGDTVVVGAFNDDIGANSDQGSAYVFVRPAGGWTNMTQTAKLTASDGAASDFFGDSVAIGGDTVVVGAGSDDIGANSNQGSAHVFTRPGSGWTNMTQTAKLTSCDGASFDSFGGSVAIGGDTVIVGASGNQIGANSFQGSAYVFVNVATSTACLRVHKDFTDTNTSNVSISLSCTGGATPAVSPLNARDNPDTPAVFTINNVPGSGTACTATETVPTGYTANQTNCADKAIAAGATVDCTITNTPASSTTATLTVHKDFTDTSTTNVSISVSCTAGATPAASPLNARDNPDTPAVFTINNVGGSGTSCTAIETTPTGYNQTGTTCSNVTLAQGGSGNCTITNAPVSVSAAPSVAAATNTPPPTATPLPFLQIPPTPRPNLSGPIAAIIGGAVRTPTAVAAAQVITAPNTGTGISITPPNTGDGGLLLKEGGD